jgi:hypothetical protein
MASPPYALPASPLGFGDGLTVDKPIAHTVVHVVPLPGGGRDVTLPQCREWIYNGGVAVGL